MSEMNMNEMMQNFSKIMNGKEIPDNMKTMLQNMINSNNSATHSFDSNNNSNSSDATDTTSCSLNNEASKHTQVEDSTTNPFGNIDIGTIMKMKNIMEKLNSKKSDPRSNLLLSLKPYLKPSRKEKVDQYIQLFAMTDILENLNMAGR